MHSMLQTEQATLLLKEHRLQIKRLQSVNKKNNSSNPKVFIFFKEF